jgi:hypothetical protein
MKTFEKFFRNKVSYEKIDRYVNLVFKTLDPDDEVYVQYEEENGSQFVKIEVLDRVLH